MWCHSNTTHENTQVICFNSIQCKCYQPQLCQSTIWTNYIMIVKITSSRNVCCTWKGIIMFKIIFIHDGCQLFINANSKLIPDMMILDLIPQAIIEVVSCECITNRCIGGVNAIKYHCIAHSPAKRESNTIRNTAIVLELWKWLSHSS